MHLSQEEQEKISATGYLDRQASSNFYTVEGFTGDLLRCERHRSHEELETSVEDGKSMHNILQALGYSPSFRYEKLRAEWTDGNGQVVVDETPIGNFCEIEGKVRWIDATAKKLGVNREHSSRRITQRYFQSGSRGTTVLPPK